MDCDIHAIAAELNARSVSHPIGDLQELRKTLKSLSRRSGKSIFSKQTTQDDWAFHHGGRSELQFNIGKDGSGGAMLRHGVAFSFETSRTLPSIEPLKPRVRLFNDFLRLYPDKYAGMRMWHFDQDGRSKEYSPSVIPPERVKEGVFQFLGKRLPIDQLDYELILRDFDQLLPLYRYVESNGAKHPTSEAETVKFSFTPGCTSKIGHTTAQLAQDPIDITLRHNAMQEALYEKLVSEFGADNVGTEQSSGIGTRVDIVVRHHESYWFYEIKTAHSPRACIREALGQLLEYSYWPNGQEAVKLFVAGETRLDVEGQAYLSLLREKFSLPIDYVRVHVSAGKSDT
jgi:hypothetical protein